MNLIILSICAFSAGALVAGIFLLGVKIGRNSWREVIEAKEEFCEAKEELCIDLEKRCARAEKQEDYWYNKYIKQRKKQQETEWWQNGESPPWES